MEEKLKKRLFERAVGIAMGWNYGQTAEEVFDNLFSSKADLYEHSDVFNKFAAVYEAVVDQLAEEGFRFPYKVVCEVWPSDISEALLVDKESGKVLYWIYEKHWHLWDSPEDLKENLLAVYRAVKEEIRGKKTFVAVTSGPDCRIYEVPAFLAEKEEFTERELEEGRLLFEMGEPVWIEIPVFEWKNGKYVKFSD